MLMKWLQNKKKKKELETFEKAIEHSHQMKAMEEEIVALKQNQTFEKAPRWFN